MSEKFYGKIILSSESRDGVVFTLLALETIKKQIEEQNPEIEVEIR